MNTNIYSVTTISRLLTLLFFIGCCVSCKKKFPCGPPGTTTCAITINNFLENCYTTVNGPVHISYKGDLVIWYFDGCTQSNQILNNPYTITSPNTPQKQPITINAVVPDKGPYWIEVNIEGLECALCANGWGGTNDNNTNHCNAADSPTGKVAAYPKWHRYFGVQTVGPTVVIPSLDHVINVDKSCGCTVHY